MYKTEISKKPTTQKTIELLLRANIDKKTKDRTPLHHAVATNNENEVKLLLDKKPDLEARDNEGRTPLHLAVVREGYEAVAKLLLDAKPMWRPRTIMARPQCTWQPSIATKTW